MSVKVLAFDTSSSACSVALQIDNQITAKHIIAAKEQAKLILPMIQELLAAASVNLNQLDAIAYGCGPGSFTGIRIASSVVQALGFASHKPIIRISSLAAMAQAAVMEQQWERLLVAVDARGGQVYWARYIANHAGEVELTGDEQASIPEDVIVPDAHEWYGIGDGWQKYEEKLVKKLGFQPKALNPSQLPTAQAILKLAAVKLAKNDTIEPFAALPSYILTPL